MTQVILRADDVCATTKPVDLHRVYDVCWERGMPVCLSVIPRSAYRFAGAAPEPVPPVDLRDNAVLCGLLAELARAELIEIALHGFEHQYGELAGADEVAIGRHLAAGLKILQEAVPGVPVRVLVPPHDYLSGAGVRAARRHGLTLCSSWAACYGGGRWAHWGARMRSRLGPSSGRTAGGDWYSDVTLLDFLGPPSADDAAAGRLLKKASRGKRPIVLPQHTWRLFDPDGLPNTRYRRWQRWFTWAADHDEVLWRRYSDE